MLHPSLFHTKITKPALFLQTVPQYTVTYIPFRNNILCYYREVCRHTWIWCVHSGMLFV